MSDFHCAKAVLKVMIGSGLGGRKKEFLPIYLVCGGGGSVQQCVSDIGWLQKVLGNLET